MSQHQRQFSIELHSDSERVVSALVNCDCVYHGAQRDCTISLSFDQTTLTAVGPDFFEAFCQIRNLLKAHHLTPHCNAASRDVYPSGMGRDMAAGMKAYRMTLGRHVTGSDLLGIFDAADDITPVSVEDQRSFYEEWRNSERV